MKHPKLLTLTLKTSTEPLKNQAKRIKEAFRRLRAHAVWKQQCFGGFWVLEITRNQKTGGFHVHIHAVIDSKYIEQAWLSRTWQRLTGDSMIVDIRTFQPKRARYLSKYVSKGSSFSEDSNVLWDYYEAFHRQRDTNTFGECTDAPPEPPKYTFIGIVSHLITAAKRGDSEAFDVLAAVESELIGRLRRREEPTTF
jgi:hypothetical protein